MRFRVLGPLAVDGAPGPMQAPKSRLLLALLVSAAGEVLPLSRLEEWMWDGRPPSAGALRWQVHRLRTELGAELIVRENGGLRLRLDLDDADDADDVDAVQFEAGLHEGRRLLQAGRPKAAGDVLRGALALWRGTAYEGLLDVAPLADESRRLHRLERVALELRIASDLEIGRHAEAAVELADLVADDPLREHVRALQLRALAGSGRRAEALAAYDEARATLVRDLGLEPGDELRQLHRALLAGTPLEPARDERRTALFDEPAATLSEPAPAELPAASGTFTGRGDELQQLTHALLDRACQVIVVAGAGGSGKSTLAVHAAQRTREGFADGQLYVDLLGSTPGASPRSPLAVLQRFLRSLGDDRGAALQDLDEAAARFRSATSGRRVLILLDNARDAAQVRPLLPGSGTSTVVVTSRNPMATLDGATRLRLSQLDSAEARQLLERLLGSDRVAQDPEAADRLTALCDRLPMALCIAAARLAAHPTWTLRHFASRLEDRSRRLGELVQDDRAVRTGLGLALDDLDAAETRILLLVALLDVPDVTTPLTAALAAVPAVEAARTLETLGESHLLEEVGARRYVLHDLTRLVARERAEADLPRGDREDAVERALHWALASVRQAVVATGRGLNRLQRGLSPEEVLVTGAAFGSEVEAIDWLDAEVPGLLAATWQAIQGPARFHSAARGLGAAIFPALASRGMHAEQLAVMSGLLRISPKSADTAWIHLDVGNTHLQLGDPAAAERHGRQALEFFARAHDVANEAQGCGVVGLALNHQGRHTAAVDLLQRGVELARTVDNLGAAAGCANNLADTLIQLERFAEAVDAAELAMDLSRKVGRHRHETMSRLTLAEARMFSGDPEEALRLLPVVIERLRELREPIAEAVAHWRSGEALAMLARTAEARTERQASLDLLVQLDRLDREEAEALLRDPAPSAPAALLTPS